MSSEPPRKGSTTRAGGSQSPPHPLAAALASGRRLYKIGENAIGPRLPTPLRRMWRRLIGRPPLPERPALPVAPFDAPSSGHFDIVCFPISTWGFRFQRPQQLMRELARRGHRVFWVDLDGLRSPAPRAPIVELERNVYQAHLGAVRPRDPFRDGLEEEDLVALEQSLAELEREQGLVGTVAIAQLPFWAPLALRSSSRLDWRIVYDCMDDHGAFSTNSAPMLASERELIGRSHLVAASSQRLYERLESQARALVLVPNACDFDHFHRASVPMPVPDPLASIPRPIVGYFGAISEWFDFNLLRHAVATHPDWSFVLIGSTWGAPAHADLERSPNVHLLGEKPYAELPGFLAQMDATLIPFRLTPLTEATDPVKVYEYLAAGKPVVASRLPELARFGDLVARVGSAEELTSAVESALREDSLERRNQRMEFARANSWRARGDSLTRALEETFPVVSAIIVTWNNLELTRRCLESLLRDRTWPKLEIVVVDNASSDGTRQYLQALAAREPTVRLVLNDDNRGFAAANNQGIRAAMGAYVVLLNNDTAVPRGSLARLIRILEADPRIGLLGPVTDGVWNEARIEVDMRSASFEQLDAFATGWARQHAGRVLPIGMLAMYCVAARRSVVDAVGPLDERFGIGMFEDDDYSHRVREAGFRVACAQEVFVHHAGQASFDKLAGKSALWEENRKKFESKWATSWRAPGLGTLDQGSVWKEAVDQMRAGWPNDRPPAILLLDTAQAEQAEPTERTAPAATDASVEHPLLALARALEANGHPVLEVREPAVGQQEPRLDSLRPRRFLSTLPLEAFESLEGAIVLLTTGRRFDLAYFAKSRVVYAPEQAAADESRREARLALLAQASIVLADTDTLDDEAKRALGNEAVCVPPLATAEEILASLTRATLLGD